VVARAGAGAAPVDPVPVPATAAAKGRHRRQQEAVPTTVILVCRVRGGGGQQQSCHGQAGRGGTGQGGVVGGGVVAAVLAPPGRVRDGPAQGACLVTLLLLGEAVQAPVVGGRGRAARPCPTTPAGVEADGGGSPQLAHAVRKIASVAIDAGCAREPGAAELGLLKGRRERERGENVFKKTAHFLSARARLRTPLPPISPLARVSSKHPALSLLALYSACILAARLLLELPAPPPPDDRRSKTADMRAVPRGRSIMRAVPRGRSIMADEAVAGGRGDVSAA